MAARFGLVEEHEGQLTARPVVKNIREFVLCLFLFVCFVLFFSFRAQTGRRICLLCWECGQVSDLPMTHKSK